MKYANQQRTASLYSNLLLAHKNCLLVFFFSLYQFAKLRGGAFSLLFFDAVKWFLVPAENQRDWCNLGAGTRSSVIVNIISNSKRGSGNPNSWSGQALIWICRVCSLPSSQPQACSRDKKAAEFAFVHGLKKWCRCLEIQANNISLLSFPKCLFSCIYYSWNTTCKYPYVDLTWTCPGVPRWHDDITNLNGGGPVRPRNCSWKVRIDQQLVFLTSAYL